MLIMVEPENRSHNIEGDSTDSYLSKGVDLPIWKVELMLISILAYTRASSEKSSIFRELAQEFLPSEMGFSSQLFNRVDVRDHALRREHRRKRFLVEACTTV